MSTTTRIMNTLFNPLTDDILAPVGSSERQRSLLHGAGLLAGYGSLAYLLRRLSLEMDEKRRKKTEYAAASSPDIMDEDPETEKTAGILGTEVISPSFPNWLLRKDLDSGHIALGVAAALAGAFGGYRMATANTLESDVEQFRDSLTEKKKKYNDLIRKEYLRTRTPGSEKIASQFSVDEFLAVLDDKYPVDPADIEKLASDLQKQANELTFSDVREDAKNPTVNPTSALSAAGKLYWLWAAAALALGYAGMKSYSDKNDPNRQRQKELEEIEKRMAQADTSPIMLSSEDLPEPSLKAMKATRPKEQKPRSVRLEAAVRRALPKVPPQLPPPVETKAVVDSSDPYAALLKG